jgi:hypothetical protein
MTDVAAAIAINTVRDFLDLDRQLQAVIFVCFDQENYVFYQGSKSKSMISRLKNLLTLSLLGLAACSGRHTGPKQPEVKKADTVAAEPQKVNFAKKFPRRDIAKVVSYSFVDEEADGLSDTGQLLQMFPGYAQYLRKNDPRPKVFLNEAQISKLLSIVNNPKTYKRGSAMCYNPRNLFCFYNSRNEIVAYYEICFECGKFDARPALTDTLKDIGLSEPGAGALDKFCRSAGISMK